MSETAPADLEAARDADRPLTREADGNEAAAAARLEPLLDEHDLEAFRARWNELQTGFVDEPRRAVKGADRLVGEVIEQVAQSFVRERDGLEEQWASGAAVSTEDLRVALRRYRSFFDRLLAA